MYTNSIATQVALGALLLLSTSAVAADDAVEAHAGADHGQIDGVRMDVHADLGNYGAFGVGLRADIPIVPNGFIQGVNDELAISPGVEVFFVNFWYDRYNGGPYVMPLVMVQWNFYTGKNWSVFPEAGVAMFVGDETYLPAGRPFYATVATGVGARYHFQDRNALLMRLSWPAGLQIGVTF